MKVFVNCWTCDKVYDASWWTTKNGVKCDECGGFVITPSGKMKFRLEGDFSEPPTPHLTLVQGGKK